MPAIPSIASFTGASVTEGEFKTALSNLHLFLTGLLGTDAASFPLTPPPGPVTTGTSLTPCTEPPRSKQPTNNPSSFPRRAVRESPATRTR